MQRDFIMDFLKRCFNIFKSMGLMIMQNISKKMKYMVVNSLILDAWLKHAPQRIRIRKKSWKNNKKILKNSIIKDLIEKF